jgi:hypothetical protein
MTVLYNVGAITPQFCLFTTMIGISFKERDMFKEFKDFAMRSNVVHIAVGTNCKKSGCRCNNTANRIGIRWR